ncbi:acyl-ACP thioesterase domain-containing protein [Vaginisenegalia massiliensis]|uniref:acyl-ACP thioesterase domain-containing protein n=1 Tax=Vaginisenegalia massiliensis TaxID=2058294 RepID=UPI0013DDA053|nr:acyl-ACP thioesterase domain-containing protein [Vaginisenegalia massiliensis]
MTDIIEQALNIANQHDRLIQESLGLNLLATGQSWVITQYQIRLNHDLVLPRDLWIDTAIIELNRFFIVRRFTVRQGSIAYIEIDTQFALFDLNQRKMGRINVDDSRLEYILNPAKSPSIRGLRRQLAETYQSVAHVIQAEDIDANHHVNNLVYLRWAFAQLPSSRWQQAQLKQVQVKYLNELLPSDQVQIDTLLRADTSSIIEDQVVIRNVTQAKDACIIGLEWQETK